MASSHELFHSGCGWPVSKLQPWGISRDQACKLTSNGDGHGEPQGSDKRRGISYSFPRSSPGHPAGCGMSMATRLPGSLGQGCVQNQEKSTSMGGRTLGCPDKQEKDCEGYFPFMYRLWQSMMNKVTSASKGPTLYWLSTPIETCVTNTGQVMIATNNALRHMYASPALRSLSAVKFVGCGDGRPRRSSRVHRSPRKLGASSHQSHHLDQHCRQIFGLKSLNIGINGCDQRLLGNLSIARD